MNGSHCGDLLEKTATALNEEAVLLMLVAVQKGNVEFECEGGLDIVSTSIKLEKWARISTKIAVFKDWLLLRLSM
jgi:hypothetical protein